MKNTQPIYLLSLLFISSLCFAQEGEVCVNHNNKSLTDAMGLKLTEINFSHNLKKTKICFAKNNQEQYRNIVREVEKYYRSVATILSSDKSKEKVLAWLKKSNTPYHTQPSKRGTFLVVYSLTEEKATENSIKLNELLYE
ncbi:MAG: hypothetical protein QM504_10525 [Pseudomonadota bacterium]